MAKTAVAPLLEQRSNESAKQFLINLQKQGHISQQELRSLAREFAARLEGEDAPEPDVALEAVLEDFDAGEIEVPEPKAGRRVPVTIDTVPDTASAKQGVKFLYNKGALSKKQAREASRVIDSTKVRPEGDKEFLEMVLRRVGAHSLLHEEAEDGPDDDEQEEGRQDDDDGADDAEGGEQEEGVPTIPEGEVVELDWPDGEPLTAGALYEMSVDAIREYLPRVEDPRVLEAIHAWERQHPNYTPGRVGVLNAVEERRGELEVPDPHEE